eukprot:NODE_819_length_3938_cov_0.505600.p1 type:complete len:662 gc:universal NODE_819_length_3938_cov_0.505600:2440-455(-)
MECRVSTIYDQLPNSCRAYVNPFHIDNLGLTYNSIVLIDGTAAHLWPTLKLKLNEIGLGDVISRRVNRGIGDVVLLKVLSEVHKADRIYIAESLEHPVMECLKDTILTLRYIQLGVYEFKAMGKWHKCSIVEMLPKRLKLMQIDRCTVIETQIQPASTVVFGGYKNHTRVISDMMKTCFNDMTSNGVIIHGQQGTGKSTIARYCSQLNNSKVYVVNCNNIVSSYFGETEVKVKSIFSQAISGRPCTILIKDMHIICQNRESNSSNLHYKITNCLLSLLDGELDLSGVFIVGTTTDIDEIDDAFKRAGRFEKDIKIDVPEWPDRIEIFNALKANYDIKVNVDEISMLMKSCHGYVGADILSLLRYAHFESLKSNKLDLEELKIAKTRQKPSALKDVLLTVPNVKWEDIGGQEETKFAIKTAIELPLQKPELFEIHNIAPTCGLLLYGPPGTGKTLLAKAIATESGLNFLSVKGPELFNKYVGESEKALKSIFDKARSVAPVVIFFDEIDAIGKTRGSESGVGDRMLVQLLTELDGIQKLSKITVLAATNRPDTLDPALIRPGRFDKLIYVSPPDLEARISIFKINISKLPCSQVDVIELAKLSDGCTGAEIQAICQEAAFDAIEQDLTSITHSMLLKACKENKTRLDATTMEYYKRFQSDND